MDYLGPQRLGFNVSRFILSGVGKFSKGSRACYEDFRVEGLGTLKAGSTWNHGQPNKDPD